MKSTNKNFLYNVLYQVFVFIIPLISTPYISRVLGVNNVGIYSYTYSIVYYFMLAAMLGINNYGAREIAKVSSDKREMSKKFFSIYFLQLFCSSIMLIAFILFSLVMNYENKNILYIQIIFLISCVFDINWFFFGLEKFKITISRNLIIKILSLIAIFIFVKTSNDLWIYTLIMSGSTLISQIYLWIFVGKEIQYEKVTTKEVFSHLPQCLILFIPVIAYSIYRIMDKTMIGALANTVELGNYESAEKIINIPISFITALGTVMMPHMAKAKQENFKENINSTFYLCSFFIIPMVVGLLFISKDFTRLFFGEEYTKTAAIIVFLLPTLLCSAMTNVIRSNFLIPKSEDKIYVASTIWGAAINLILNLIFISRYGAYGACIGTVAAEFTVMFYQIWKTRKSIEYFSMIKNIFPIIAKSIVMGGVIFIVSLVVENMVTRLVLQIILAVLTYFVLNENYIIYDFLGKTRKQK